MADANKKTRMRLWAVAFWLIVWQAAAQLVGKEILLVSPVRTVTRLWELAGEPVFWNSVVYTLVRIAEGFALGTAAGVLLAVPAGRWRAVRDLLAGDAEFAVRYHAMCNRKLQFLLGRISLLTAQSCRTRLAAYLLLNRGTDSFIRLHGSKDELASRLSVSRAAVYRELSRLQAMGLIQVTRQGVSLKDAEALERQLYDERNEGAQPAPANNKE